MHVPLGGTSILGCLAGPFSYNWDVGDGIVVVVDLDILSGLL